MKPTKHATTNYRNLEKFIHAVDATENHAIKLHSGGYMPLSIERIGFIQRRAVYSIAHYGQLNGDLMADPEMTIVVDTELRTIEPLSFRNDYMGLSQEVYCDNGRQYRPRLRTDLDDFLWHWIKNIIDQGFTPNKF